MTKRNIKRLEQIELENDINTILAGIYNVSAMVSKNTKLIARELIKLGYRKEQPKDGTQ